MKDYSNGAYCTVCPFELKARAIKQLRVSFIPRLHDEANIKQTSSRYHANVFNIHVHDVCSKCFIFA